MTNRGEYIQPWSRQRKLKERYSYEEVPDLNELNDIINSIEIGKVNVQYQTMRGRALFAMYYLTAARVSEITKCLVLRKQRGRNHYLEKHGYLGIRKKDIKIGKIEGRKCMLIRIENRKNAKRKTKRQPIPLELERDIALHVYKYIKRLDEDSVLFPFGAKRATQIINTTGFNIHFIRHIRATHLVTLYDFSEQSLIKYMGWANANPAQYYLELKPKYVFRQFFKQ